MCSFGIKIACSVGVFFGRPNGLLAKAHIETRKMGRRVTIFTLPFLPPS